MNNMETDSKCQGLNQIPKTIPKINETEEHDNSNTYAKVTQNKGRTKNNRNTNTTPQMTL